MFDQKSWERREERSFGKIERWYLAFYLSLKGSGGIYREMVRRKDYIYLEGI